MSLPRMWFATVRMVEVAALAVVVGALLELWVAFQSTAQMSPDSPDGSPPATAPLVRRIVALVLYSGIFRAPVDLVLAAMLLAVAVAVLGGATSVSNFRVLRWEVLAVWLLTALVVLVLVLLNVVAMFVDNPFASADPSVVTADPGPGLVEQAIGGLLLPLAAAVLLGCVALWWLRLPRDLDDPDEPAEPRRRERPRVQPPVEVDALVLDGVEQIEPVERLQARERSPADGASASGYEDYFRKF